MLGENTDKAEGTAVNGESKLTIRNGVMAATRTERASLWSELAGLTEEQWASPSLCGKWTVEDTVAHLIAAASIGPARWMRSVLGARFDFDLHNQRRLEEQRGPTSRDTLLRFENILDSSTSTFGPKEAWLGEVVVHSNDIRRTLGLPGRTTVAASTAVAEFYARTDFTVPGKTTISGLKVTATDGPFRKGDSGPALEGPTLALVMVMAGRSAFTDQLRGPGLDVLVERIGD